MLQSLSCVPYTPLSDVVDGLAPASTTLVSVTAHVAVAVGSSCVLGPVLEIIVAEALATVLQGHELVAARDALVTAASEAVVGTAVAAEHAAEITAAIIIVASDEAACAVGSAIAALATSAVDCVAPSTTAATLRGAGTN